jgi:maleylacetoacetate isomerase
MNTTNTPVLYRLYHYWRSSSSWRVRIALHYKNLPHEEVPVSLLNDEANSPAHLARHPSGFVPVLELLNSTQPSRFLTESLGMIRYLDEKHPETTLGLNDRHFDAFDRARIFALSEIVNAGTQPLQNIPVMEYVSPDPAVQKKWNQHWIENGLRIFEQSLAAWSPNATQFCYGNQLTVADLCLVPQCYNAERFGVDISQFPMINALYANLSRLPSIAATHPDRFKP